MDIYLDNSATTRVSPAAAQRALELMQQEYGNPSSLHHRGFAAEQALDGKEFVNEFTRNHFVAELKKAIADPANKGKRAVKLFEEMTKDLDGIFRNPQQEPLKLPGVDKHAGPPMSKEDIFKITDAAERQKAIAANINLFRKDE